MAPVHRGSAARPYASQGWTQYAVNCVAGREARYRMYWEGVHWGDPGRTAPRQKRNPHQAIATHEQWARRRCSSSETPGHMSRSLGL
jgi:hypothetical protein